MKIGLKPKNFIIGGRSATIRRTIDGVCRIEAKKENDYSAALGFMHAHDRLTQMILVRTALQGKLCELFIDTDENLEIDIFMRKMAFEHTAKREVKSFTGVVRNWVEAYCDGINEYVQRHGLPIELKLIGYRFEPWQAADVIMLLKAIGYLGLGQSQQDAEKWIIESIKKGSDPELLKKLFSPHLDEMDDSILDAIKELSYVDPLMPESIRFHPFLPKVKASNNWVISGKKSESGYPIQCNDPHLECNRLPGVWYEVVANFDQTYAIGITMPGVPALIMGRTRDVSYGFTYGFMDQVDYFIEDIKDGKYRIGDEYHSYEERQETINRKNAESVVIHLYENHHGYVECPLQKTKIKDGKYLSMLWTGHKYSAISTLEACFNLYLSNSVSDCQKEITKICLSANWLIADKKGNIAYQQSGHFPKRKQSGLFPVLGWSQEGDWQGLHSEDELAAEVNPTIGIIATANEERNNSKGSISVNLPMSSYRVERIRDLLLKKQRLSLHDMKLIQNDIYSKQAECFMALIRPHLPNTPIGKLLEKWDCRYKSNSKAAVVFEKIYKELVAEVVGNKISGKEAWEYILDSTCIFADYHGLFDKAILAEKNDFWYDQETQEEVFARVVTTVIKATDASNLLPWEMVRQVTMKNIFFDGKLPRLFRVDHGPISLKGNQATILQGQIYNSHGRQTSFSPSWRYITDLRNTEVLTVLAGGPRDRPWSKWYKTDVNRWLNGEYKSLTLNLRS